MADEDTRSSGGTQDDDKLGSMETGEPQYCWSPTSANVEGVVGSPCGSSGGANPRPDQQQLTSTCKPLLDIHKGRPIRLQVRVLVPIKDHPNYNFVGKLLGPKGNSLKRLQEETQTKMAILGRGSMRDRAKEEELRATGDPKHGHLRDDLHVEVTAFAPAAEAYARMAHALAEVKRFLVPDYYDDIRQNQLRELAVLNGNRKRGGKAPLPDDVDYEEGAVAPRLQEHPRQSPFAQQQRLQVPMNGSSPQPPLPGAPHPQQKQNQSLRLVPRSGSLVGRPVRAVPHRHGPGTGLVRSFVTSVCGGGGQPTLFREVTLAAPASAPEPARIQYLTEEDAFTFEEGFPCGDPQRPDDFSLRPSPAFVSHGYRDEEDSPDGLYESHNGYTAAKDFIGEDWPQSKGSPVQSSVQSSVQGPLRPGPSAGRLKAVPSSSAPVRPNRSLYREHPYFTAAVARY